MRKQMRSTFRTPGTEDGNVKGNAPRSGGAELDGWTDKLRRSELDITSECDMHNGAWRKFDIDEAIITSDRRKAEQATKNSVPDAEGPGDSEPA